MASLLDMIGSADGTPAANYLKGGRHVVKASRVTWREPTAKIPRASFRIDGEILKSSNEKHASQVGQTGTMNLGFKYPNDDLARMRRALSALGTSIGVGHGAEGSCSESEAAERATEFTSEKQPLVGAIVVVVAQEDPQKGDPNKTFTKYEVVLPTAKDLEGLDL
jgi:L-alanine-DL-glutamate epimerase-like enolase superfamily enzyme